MHFPLSAAAAFIFLSTIMGASAQTPASGTFVAQRACPATRSIHGGPRADDASVEPGASYPLVGKNKPDATHYLIEVEGAEPLRRWVATNCGSIEEAAGTGAPPAGTAGSQSADGAFNLIAVSWQPAFCETHQDKTECATQTAERFDATHFALHGLWPQPRGVEYCDVAPSYKEADADGAWSRLPPVALSEETRAALAQAMPGTMSNLERHEWIKHGTCFQGGRSQEAYFARALALMAQLNASRVRDLFAGNIGRTITAAQIKQAFDESFGPGAGDRVRVSCPGSSRRIVEMTIGLVGEIGDNPTLATLIAAAPRTSTGCPSGVVDPAGFR
jgi:ribonuclease T2